MEATKDNAIMAVLRELVELAPERFEVKHLSGGVWVRVGRVQQRIYGGDSATAGAFIQAACQEECRQRGFVLETVQFPGSPAEAFVWRSEECWWNCDDESGADAYAADERPAMAMATALRNAIKASS